MPKAEIVTVNATNYSIELVLVTGHCKPMIVSVAQAHYQQAIDMLTQIAGSEMLPYTSLY